MKSQNYSAACVVAKIVKSINSRIVVIVGGPHATLTKADVLTKYIDIGVIGEGEETLLDILDSIEGVKKLSSINGIVYRKNNQNIKTPSRSFISNLDVSLHPINVAKKILIDYEKYPKKSFRNIFASRGCPYKCSFCSTQYIWGGKVRYRSVDNIISEIGDITKLDINYVLFCDDIFGVDKPFTKKLCFAIKKEFPKLKWGCEMHVNLVNNEIIAIMKSAGCIDISIGVESGNNNILKLINKNITIERAFSAAKIIKRNKINLYAFFIVGHPHETKETLDDTISAITSFPCNNIIYSIFTPYVGTELFKYCLSKNIVSKDFDVSLYNHQSPKNHFCPNIDKSYFQKRLHELEKKISRINSKRKIKMYLSISGILKIKELGLRRCLSGFCHLFKKIIT